MYISVVCQGGTVPGRYLVHHERSDSSANLIVGLGFAMRTQQDEEKPVGTEIKRLINAKHAHSKEILKRGDVRDTHLVGTGTSVRPPRVVA